MRNVFDKLIQCIRADPALKPLIAAILLALLAGCSISNTAAPSATIAPPSSTPSATSSPTATLTAKATATQTPTFTPTPTVTLTPTVTHTRTVTPTPTEVLPQGTVLMQAFCRYGPGKAYLYSHGLFEGDHVTIDGRSPSASWLWVKPDNLERHCWAAASVMEVSGDPRSAPVVTTELPHSTLYGPPEEVEAYREGDQVTVVWSRVWMTEDDDRGYLIEATICQGGGLVSVAVQTNETSYTFTDETGCGGASGGRLYTVEKHGYTDPVEIPWP
jgi:hypothetical protein